MTQSAPFFFFFHWIASALWILCKWDQRAVLSSCIQQDFVHRRLCNVQYYWKLILANTEHCIAK